MTRKDKSTGRVGVARRVAACLLTVGAIGSLAVSATQAFFTASPIASSRVSRQETFTLLPQGWGFFTRSPRERWYTYWSLASGQWSRVDLKGTSIENWFGLRRRSRIRLVRLGMLHAALTKADWRPCHGEMSECVKTLPAGSPHAAVSWRDDALCRSIVIVSAEPWPWAWASLKRPLFYQGQIARVDVRCKAQ